MDYFHNRSQRFIEKATKNTSHLKKKKRTVFKLRTCSSVDLIKE